MPLNTDTIRAGASGAGVSSFYPTTIDQSLRFDGSSSRLDRTPSTDGDRKKWTSSWWVKRSKLGALQYMWSGASFSGNDGVAALYFNSDDKIHMYFDSSGSNPYGAINNRVYRDTTNWYHIVWAVDAANTQTKVWVNGVEETSSIQPPNYSYGMNKASTQTSFGVASWGGSPNFSGYLAEFVHLDGQYLDETSFGEFKNGVWVPKDIYAQGFTFGTNGFYLTFQDSSNIGNDYQTSDRSGTTNDYTPTGLTATDVVLDSCTNNFCTLNPLNTNYNIGQATFSEGNLRITSNSANRGFTTGTFKLSGKHYFEVYYKADNSGFVGINDINNNAPNTGGQSIHIYDGSVRIDGSSIGSVTTFSVGDVIGVEVDIDAKTIEFFKNGVSVSDNTYTTDAEYFPYIYDSSGGRIMDLVANFGQDASFAGNKTSGSDDASDSEGQGTFYETPSSGFLALCSANEPDTTLSPNKTQQADFYFDTVLYTGNATDDHAITGVGFQPDWVWLKARGFASGHALFDSTRGALQYIASEATSAESTLSGTLKSFDSDGFTLGTNNGVNRSATTFVSWNWKANGGTTSSNTDGSITSTIQASTDSGFSIVTYTGTGANATIGHGLNSAPEIVFYKSRDTAQSWAVSNKTIGGTYTLYLNLVNDRDSTTGTYNSTLPTSTVLHVGTAPYANKSGDDFVAYAFHSVEGFSKIGWYSSIFNADGNYIYCGFRPQWVMIKAYSGVTDAGWIIYDDVRDTDNYLENYLFANYTNAETTNANLKIDFLSNGFKIRGNNSNIGGGSDSYIFLTFARQPFKFSNAR